LISGFLNLEQQHDESAYVDVADSTDSCDRNGPEDAQEPNEGCADNAECFGHGKRLDGVFPDLKFVSFKSSVSM
jgi:hypothetical protein